MMYKVIVAGTVVGSYENKAEAEKRLFEIRHSFLATIHPTDTIFIKEEVKA